MLIDEVERLTLTGGHGGAGVVAFFPGKTGGPAGGNGGRGGDVYISTTQDLTALNQFSKKKTLAAANGAKGSGGRCSGKDGSKYMDFKEFEMNKIKVKIQDFKHPVYQQQWQSKDKNDFSSHMSILDLLFNHGPNSLSILRNQNKK